MPMPQEFSDYRSKLQSQIQDEYGRVVYTYTCHHKIADRLSGRNSKLKVYQIILSAVSTGGFLGTLITNQQILVWVGGLFSTALLALNSCYEMTFFNRKSQRTFTCQIVQNTERHLKRAKTMQISGIGHSVIRGLVTTGQWFSASTTVYPRGSPQGRRHSYFVDC